MSELMKMIPDAEASEEEETRFTVDNDAKAEWCLGKIREKRAELKKWQDHYDALKAAMEKEIEGAISYFENLLQSYFLQQHEQGLTRFAKTQESYSLPSGKLVYKQQEPTYDRDPEKLLPWLKANHPELVKVKEEENWKALKDLLVISGDVMVTEDAEVVPGIKVTARPDAFRVEVKEAKKNGTDS